ncbi:YjbQ family protein [Candidatus Woesearchaeota archaeon]|nr:YjbQ family protein [Candidatus Woesearchaeota archaeon]
MIFTVSSSKHQELIDITDKVNKILSESGVKEGICNIFTLHATAAIVINENYDPNIGLDFLDAINKAIPERANYRHDRIDGNAASHIKAAILSPSETIPVKQGRLVLGTWQSLMLVELDGPRSDRKVNVEIIRK